MNIISILKAVKTQKQFLVKLILIVVIAVSLFIYCICSNLIFNGVFVCIFTYYLIKLLIIQYYD